LSTRDGWLKSKDDADVTTTAEDVTTTAEDVTTTAEDVTTTAEDVTTTAEDVFEDHDHIADINEELAKEKNVDDIASIEKESNQSKIERYPCARFPDQIVLGDIVPLEVIIKSFKPPLSNYSGVTSIILEIEDEKQNEIPVQVIVECIDDGFEIDGKYYGIINVPVNIQDSNPIIFNVKSKREGKHAIVIRLFQQTSYIGQIKIESLVTSSDNRGSVVSVSDSQIKEWKSDSAILENTPPGPDITIFIHERKVSSEFEYDVLISSLDTPIQEMGPIKFQFNPETKFHKIFEDIENFSGHPNIIDKKIKAKGMSLYDELFPSLLKELYWEKADRIKSIRVISKEPWIPWEIIKPWHKLENGEIKEDLFLCEKYAFSRWVVGKSEGIKDKIKSIKVVVPNDTNLVAAVGERNWIEKFAKQRNIKISFDSSYDQIMNTLETEKEIDILHFSTHGESNTESPLLSALELEGHVHLRPEEIVGKAMTFGQSHPIVILNACQSGNQNFSLTGIQGWATKFLDAGASVFIGTLWSVNDVTAFNFVKEFYTQLSSGTSLGESVKIARNKAKIEGDTSWLAYQVYGHPNYKIKF
jgi:CHAT domain